MIYKKNICQCIANLSFSFWNFLENFFSVYCFFSLQSVESTDSNLSMWKADCVYIQICAYTYVWRAYSELLRDSSKCIQRSLIVFDTHHHPLEQYRNTCSLTSDLFIIPFSPWTWISVPLLTETFLTYIFMLEILYW